MRYDVALHRAHPRRPNGVRVSEPGGEPTLDSWGEHWLFSWVAESELGEADTVSVRGVGQ
jgi:hypothetical protein